MEVENHHFATTMETGFRRIINGCQKFEEEWDIYVLPEYLLRDYLLITKREMVTLQWGNLTATALLSDQS